MKIVVFTCSTGGGHNACAKYIKEEFNLNGIECDVKDYFELIGPKASSMAEKIYLDSTKGKGSIFGGVYKLGELYSKTNIPSPVYGLNVLVKDKLKNFLKENGYTLAMGTHLFPCLALTKLKKEEPIHFINVATDYACIPFWEETNPDAFVIPSALLREEFVKKGIRGDVILPFGIPVATTFINARVAEDLPKDKDIVLIASGSMGAGSTRLCRRRRRNSACPSGNLSDRNHPTPFVCHAPPGKRSTPPRSGLHRRLFQISLRLGALFAYHVFDLCRRGTQHPHLRGGEDRFQRHRVCRHG